MNRKPQTANPNQIYNALTIDVEDYYMVSAFSDIVRFEDWHSYESHVEKNTYKILDVLAKHEVNATFFILGWVAEQHPELVKQIHANGHEVACHGYNHRLTYNLTPEQFIQDVRKSKDILENIIGESVIGYRAASYSIIKKTLWVLDILIEHGFLYDSSIFPIHHDRYGLANAPRFPHTIKRNTGTIIEFPPTTCKILKQNIPVGGGGYFRLFPLLFTKKAIKRINEKEKQSAIVYIHPWEIDPDQPRLNGSWKSNARHYININSTMPKLINMLKEFKFKPLSTFLSEVAISEK